MEQLRQQMDGVILESGYVYIDNKSPVLAVAHADVSPRIEHIILFDDGDSTFEGKKLVRSPTSMTDSGSLPFLRNLRF